MSGGNPSSLRAAHIGAGKPTGWKMNPVWDAPADASVPGRSFFALLKGSDVGEGTAVLHPPAEWGDPSLNDSSLTFRLGREPGVLLTGDLEARGEAAVLAGVPALLRAAVLKVPIH